MNDPTNKIADSRICAIVVTYNPDIEILKSQLNVTLSFVNQFVIVNNGCTVDALETLQNWHQQNQASLINLQHNLGLAYGLNRGIDYALSHNYTHVVLFDQDSIPDPDMLPTLQKAYIALAEDFGNVAAVGPSHRDPRTGFRSEFNKIGRFYKSLDGVNLFQVNYLQSSGSLISLDIFKEYGLMDEDLFIHHVDQEWFYRLSSYGYSGFGVQEACMTHLVGDKTITLPFGFNRDVHLYSPFRNYYTIRNTIKLCKRNYMPLKWKIVEFSKAIFVFLFHLIFSKPRSEQYKMMKKGMIDGFFNKG
jgi:rhamnosyltransferase